MRSKIAYFAAVLLTSCSSQPQQNSGSTGDQTSPVDEPSAPTHHYVMVDNKTYGYEKAISDDDKNAGRGVNALVMFRYRGEKNGVHTVENVDDDGSHILSESCETDCKYIKLENGSRIAFSTDTLGGAVMEDAIKGQLEVYDPKPKKR